MYDIHRGEWAEELLEQFGVDVEWLPRVVDSAGVIAETDPAAIPDLVNELYELGFGPQPGPDPWPPTRPMLVGSYTLDGRAYRIHLHVQPVGGDFGIDLRRFGLWLVAGVSQPRLQDVGRGGKDFFGR